ncbi:MAG: tannase [Alphaproteobacteria bacterium]|nr:tannase [Alphaproteobacteria bacterium]
MSGKFLCGAVIGILAALSACGGKEGSFQGKIDRTKWLYHAEDRVYYQLGIPYVSRPVSDKHQKLAVFVPEAYMSCRANGDGTHTCSVNKNGNVAGYTATSAPVVFPVETPGYMDNPALTEYQSFKEYADAGMVYVYAGCRGRSQGAPAGVTDLKAAIRYIRRNADVLPIDSERFFVAGMSGGGAQSAILGASGNSALYEPYLKQIGAVQNVRDAVAGVMAWCPVTNLDSGNEAYEWQMGMTRSGLSEQQRKNSDQMAEAFAGYINAVGLKGPDGRGLTLQASADGIYQAGSYYDFLKGVVENSLNDFLNDTAFPYDADKAGRDGAAPAFLNKPKDVSFEEKDNIKRQTAQGDVVLSGVYADKESYLADLNAKKVWVVFNEDTKRYEITSLADFAKAMKPATKGIGAFDDLNKAQGENTLFGYGDGQGAHFDGIMAGLLEKTEYAAAFQSDLSRRDFVGNPVSVRLDMYTPLYYLLPAYQGYKTASVAPYWRIRTGISQSDTALTTEVNLAQALENYFGTAAKVDFKTVWGLKHVKAETTGNSTQNFIDWVNAVLKADQ